MRILSLYYTHKRGGFCKRLYRLLNALAQRGHQVHYLTLDPVSGEIDPKVQVHYIPFPTSKRSGLIFWGLFTLWCPLFVLKSALKFRPERIVVFGAYYSSMAALSKIFLGVPIVLFLRSLVFKIDQIVKKPAWVRFFSEAVDRFGISISNSLVCMTKAMQLELEQFLGKKIENCKILPNDLSPIISLNQEQIELTASSISLINKLELDQKLVLLTSGVIDQRKNIQLLIDAFKLLETRYQDQIHLLIAGDGPLRANLQSTAKQQGISNITFLGWCELLEPLYPLVDLVVHPSMHEGMPNSVLEALAYNKAVLMNDSPELREIIEHRKALFSNSATELALRLTELLNNPAELTLLEKICKEHSRKLNFDWNQKATEIVELA